jgi:hypothetical protein
MRALPTIVLGLAAGVAGALAINAIRSNDAPPAAPRPAAPPPRAAAAVLPAIVPPGWDHRYVEPPGDLDHGGVAPEPAPAAAAPSTDRDRDKAAHYEEELAARAAKLADHAREGVDAAWATDHESRVRAAVAELGVTARDVDCRSKTCVATLALASPAAALALLRGRDMSKLASGFSGLSSTPTPPSGDGSYELTVVLER